MTANQKARVQILENNFHANFDHVNPYIRANKVFQNWYSKHTKEEPIPKELLPAECQFNYFNFLEAVYIASKLAKGLEYSTLLAYGEYVKGSPVEEAVWSVIAETRPCGCAEAQWSLFCNYYGMENCDGSEDS